MSVFVAMPCSRGIEPATMCTVMGLASRLQARGVALNFYPVVTGTCENARALALDRFRRTADPLLFWIDSDVAFDPELFDRMDALDRPFVACAYPNKEPRGGGRFIVDLIDNKIDDAGTLRAHSVGFGCVLWRRAVADRLLTAYADTAYKFQGHGAAAEPIPGIFRQLVDERGYLRSEDEAACLRWRKLGEEVTILADATLEHWATGVGSDGLRWRANLADALRKGARGAA